MSTDPSDRLAHDYMNEIWRINHPDNVRETLMKEKGIRTIIEYICSFEPASGSSVAFLASLE
jgi:hypothetical protein